MQAAVATFLRERAGWRRAAAVLSAAALTLALCARVAQGGTTGSVCGRMTDREGQAVEVATVRIVAQPFGASTNDAGEYCLSNVPPGTYEVLVSRVGFQTVRVTGVVVSADNTTALDVQLAGEELLTQEVVITAERPPVDLNLTSSAARLTTEEIEALPVQELADIVNLQAGVVDGHFRGGRLGEVQYQVDGVSVNNPFDNASILRLDRSLLQEVQVISGTFDAEYGQAMSGVVNAVLKDGSKEYSWSAELFTGGYAFGGEPRRLAGVEIRPNDIRNAQLTLRGPLPLRETVILASGGYYSHDNHLRATRRFVPTDSSDFEQKVFVGTGNGEELPLGYSRRWSGLLKLTNTAVPNAKINYQLMWERTRGREADYAFRFNPEGLSRQRWNAFSHGLDWTHTFGASTFLEVKVYRNHFTYRDNVYDDVYDPRYDAAGPPLRDPGYELGAYVQGVEFTRFRQKTYGSFLKSTLVRQTVSGHTMKVGGEFFTPRIEFGTPGFLSYTTVDGRQALVRHVNEPPDFPGVQGYDPVVAAGFAQDEIRLRGLTLRAGLRWDLFDARATVPSDPANPANAIAGAPPSVPRPTTRKTSLSPRLGVAYPVLDEAALHFAYGHFRQFPAVGDMFSNADYSVLARLQAGGISYGVMGNPDIRPEETVQYEAGYKQVIDEDIGLDVTTFYKDIRSLLGVEFVSTYNGAEYARLTNVDFGNVFGVTIALDHRRVGPASVALDYTWQQALGNSSDPRETATRASAGEDPRPRLVAFKWDQRHTFNMTITLDAGGGLATSAVLRAASGQPYTPVLESGFGYGLETNSGRKPSSAVLDLRMEKALGSGGRGPAVFTRIFNVFDARYFNGPVFASTGSPFYSRFPEADAVQLADPSRFYPPRRIEIGARFGSGSP